MFGVYKKVTGTTGVGKLYQVLFPVRHHHTGAISVVYLPLRVEPEWAGTIRPCILEIDEFREKFEFVSMGLPEVIKDEELTSEHDERDRLLSEAQLKLRDGYNDELSRAIAQARNILNFADET